MTKLNLITGGSGFIGKHLVNKLVGRGEHARVLDINPSPELDELAAANKIEFIQGSILGKDVLSKAFQNVTHVYHLAANPHLWAKDKKIFDQVNYIGTLNILEAAKETGVEKFIHTSTESIFITKNSPDIIDETYQPEERDMLGAYCLSKLKAEQAVIAAAKDGLPAVVVNPTVPIGPGDTSFTPPTKMLQDFLAGKAPFYLETNLNLVHVDDVAEGHILAAEKGRIGERYILGGENIKISEMLLLLEEISGIRMPKKQIPYFIAHTFAVISEFMSDYITGKSPMAPLTGVKLAGAAKEIGIGKARAELGYEPRTARKSLENAMGQY